MSRYFTLTERQIIQQKGIDLNSLPTVFDNKAPVIQFSSQKLAEEAIKEEETPKEEEKSESVNQVFNQDDFDEVWMLDEEKNDEQKDEDKSAAEVTKPQEPQQRHEEIIAKNSEITPESRNFKGVAFSPTASWRCFFFVYNRLVGEGFGHTLAVR